MYNVRAADGRVYGPADLPTLQQWVHEGRILPHTMLIDSGSLREFPAAELQGLFTAQPTPETTWAQPPTHSPYPRGQQQYGPAPVGYAEQEMRTGWTYFWVGIVGLVCCVILSFVMFPLAIGQANKAQRLGYNQAQTLKTLSIVFLVVAIVMFGGGILFNSMFMNSFLPGRGF